MINIKYGIQKQQLKHLSKNEYLTLRELCFLSKNIYNVALYNTRQHFFNTNKYLGYNNNYHLCKENENYQISNKNSAQQIIKYVDREFKSFFALLKLKAKGKYDKKVNIPKYRKKNGYFNLIFSEFSIIDNIFSVPMSPLFKKLYGKIEIQVPSNLKDKIIKEVRIIPKNKARFFEIQYVYEISKEEKNLNKNNVLAIDLGVNNLCTCVTNHGKSFIIDGKKLKSINQWYNKYNAKLQSIKDKQKIDKLTKKQYRILNKRNNIINDYINKTCRYIINYCLINNIGTIVLGYNPQIQDKINIGKANNQTFVNIPIGQINKKLSYLSERYGIIFKEQEESYTSKSSFFDNDILPVFDIKNCIKYIFSGKRISRGQYKTSNGYIFNADCNGSLNILKKSKMGGQRLQDLQNRGRLDMPLRIRIV